jgi:hypothetical protein
MSHPFTHRTIRCCISPAFRCLAFRNNIHPPALTRLDFLFIISHFDLLCAQKAYVRKCMLIRESSPVPCFKRAVSPTNQRRFSDASPLKGREITFAGWRDVPEIYYCTPCSINCFHGVYTSANHSFSCQQGWKYSTFESSAALRYPTPTRTRDPYIQ